MAIVLTAAKAASELVNFICASCWGSGVVEVMDSVPQRSTHAIYAILPRCADHVEGGAWFKSGGTGDLRRD
jgi:hypothetical protein